MNFSTVVFTVGVTKIMDSRPGDWFYWHFFAITIDYSAITSQITRTCSILVLVLCCILLSLYSQLLSVQSQSYIATDGQSVSLGVEPHIYYSLTVEVLFLWDALSDERTGLHLYMLLALASKLASQSLIHVTILKKFWETAMTHIYPHMCLHKWRENKEI
jgi:hypothetical protein